MQQADMCIREASPADMAQVLCLYAAAGIGSATAFDEAQAKAQLAVFARYPFYRVFVATLAGRVVGTYELVVLDNLAKAGAKTAVVEDVAVDPEVQGQGIGRAMMAHAKTTARAQGAYKLMLSSNKVRAEAHAFYTSLGFVQHGLSFCVEP